MRPVQGMKASFLKTYVMSENVCSWDADTWKETYINEKRPTQSYLMKRDKCKHMIWKETYENVCSWDADTWKETYINEKRPMNRI